MTRSFIFSTSGHWQTATANLNSIPKSRKPYNFYCKNFTIYLRIIKQLVSGNNKKLHTVFYIPIRYKHCFRYTWIGTFYAFIHRNEIESLRWGKGKRGFAVKGVLTPKCWRHGTPRRKGSRSWSYIMKQYPPQ